MRSFTSTAIAATAAICAHRASAAATSFCTGDSKDVCFKWGVPESSASSDSGNIYFQIAAKDSYQWAALGIGSQMPGSDIFLIYQDGSGNVTLSTRKATDYDMPQYSERSDVELLAGSGVVDNQMVANIKCSQCDGLKLSGSNEWIAAWRQGSSVDSTSLQAIIQGHDDNDIFAVDFAQATISSDSNPFVNASSSDPDSSGSDAGSAVTDVGGGGASEGLVHAHGIVMSIVFLLGYPIGALLMPLVGKWYIHAGWQTLVFLGMWAGFGIGYHLASQGGYWWTQRHVRLGTIVCALLVIQPILGFAHHRHYLKHQQRGIVSYAHIWYGRILMVLGIINGGLGIQLSGNSSHFIITYSVVAGVVTVLYIAGTLFRGMTRTKRAKIASPQMAQEENRKV